MLQQDQTTGLSVNASDDCDIGDKHLRNLQSNRSTGRVRQRRNAAHASEGAESVVDGCGVFEGAESGVDGCGVSNGFESVVGECGLSTRRDCDERAKEEVLPKVPARNATLTTLGLSSTCRLDICLCMTSACIV